MPTTLYHRLGALLKSHPLQWISKSEYPIEAVRLTFWSVWGWEKQEKDFYDDFVQMVNQDCQVRPCPCENVLESYLFYSQCPNDCQKKAWHKLEEILDNPGFVSYRKPTGQPDEYALLILVRQGLTLVGIRTKLIQA